MERLDVTSTRALRTLLAGQPVTGAKVNFAWTIAAGPTLARKAHVAWTPGGVLRLSATSDAWRREIVRARPMIVERLTALLGPGVFRSVVIDTDEAIRPRTRHA